MHLDNKLSTLEKGVAHKLAQPYDHTIRHDQEKRLSMFIHGTGGSNIHSSDLYILVTFLAHNPEPENQHLHRERFASEQRCTYGQSIFTTVPILWDIMLGN